MNQNFESKARKIVRSLFSDEGEEYFQSELFNKDVKEIIEALRSVHDEALEEAALEADSYAPEIFKNNPNTPLLGNTIAKAIRSIKEKGPKTS